MSTQILKHWNVVHTHNRCGKWFSNNINFWTKTMFFVVVVFFFTANLFVISFFFFHFVIGWRFVVKVFFSVFVFGQIYYECVCTNEWMNETQESLLSTSPKKITEFQMKKISVYCRYFDTEDGKKNTKKRKIFFENDKLNEK